MGGFQGAGWSGSQTFSSLCGYVFQRLDSSGLAEWKECRDASPLQQLPGSLLSAADTHIHSEAITVPPPHKTAPGTTGPHREGARGVGGQRRNSRVLYWGNLYNLRTLHSHSVLARNLDKSSGFPFRCAVWKTMENLKLKMVLQSY